MVDDSEHLDQREYRTPPRRRPAAAALLVLWLLAGVWTFVPYTVSGSAQHDNAWHQS